MYQSEKSNYPATAENSLQWKETSFSRRQTNNYLVIDLDKGTKECLTLYPPYPQIIPNSQAPAQPNSLLSNSYANYIQPDRYTSQRRQNCQHHDSIKQQQEPSRRSISRIPNAALTQMISIEKDSAQTLPETNRLFQRREKMTVSPSISPNRNNLPQEQFKRLEHNKSENHFLRSSIRRDKQICFAQTQPEIIFLEEDPPSSKNLAFSQVSDNFRQKIRRSTRSKAKSRRLSFQEIPYIAVSDRQTKLRFKVAKYRYGFPELNETIHQLSTNVSNGIHLGQRALVPDQPSIPSNTLKHKIFVESLRAQLSKRRFIDLD